MEVTIETNQVLVIQRRQVTRSWRSESGTEDDFARLGQAGGVGGETTMRQGVEDTSTFPDAADAACTISRRSLLGATALGATAFARRLLNGLWRRGRPESRSPRLKGQKSKDMGKA
jgi:hypothetical protein